MLKNPTKLKSRLLNVRNPCEPLTIKNIVSVHSTYVVGRYTHLFFIIEALEDTEAAYNKDYLLQLTGNCIFHGQKGRVSKAKLKNMSEDAA